LLPKPKAADVTNSAAEGTCALNFEVANLANRIHKKRCGTQRALTLQKAV
jgi:hypothetical protein